MQKLYLTRTWALVLLGLLLPGWSALAQIVSLPDATTAPTGTSGNGFYAPNAYYGYMRTGNIYYAAELPNSGAGVIQKVAVYVGASANTTSIPLKIYIGNVGATTAFATSSWATVSALGTLSFNGSIVNSPVGWVEVTLATPFSYSGTGNIFVGFESNYGGGGSSPYTTFRYTTTTGNNRLINFQQDNTPPTGTSAATARVTNIRFFGTGRFAPPACTGTPAGGTASSSSFCANQSVAVSVTGSVTGAAYTYQWQVESPYLSSNWVDISGATGATYITPAINSNNNYRRNTTCSASGLTGTSAAGTQTYTPVSTFPYAEGFDVLPLCGWTVNDANADGSTWGIYAATFTGSSSPNLARYVYNGTNAANDWLFTPAFVTTASKAYNASLLYACASASYPESFEIYWGTANTPAAMTNLIYSSGSITSTTALTANANSFVPGAGTIYIGIKATSAANQFYLNIDNFQVTETVVCSGTPATPTVPASIGACTGSPVTIAATGASSGGGITYQWQVFSGGSWISATGGSGANSTTYTTPNISSAAQYRLVTTCPYGSSSTSSTVNITINPFYACYCSAGLQGALCASTGSRITNVTIGGTTLNNTTTCSDAAGNAYSKFGTTPASVTATLNKGLTYSLSVTTDAAAIESVWIDLDQSGTFDASEWYQVATSSTANVAATISISIPNTIFVPTGITGLRVRSRGLGNPNGSGDACSGFFSGETEDYQVTIAPAPTCSGTPTGGSVSSVLACNGNGTLTATGQTGLINGISYQWEQFDGSSWSNATGTGGTTSTFTATGVAAVTQYRLRVTCAPSSATSYSSVATVTPLVYYPFADASPYNQLFNSWATRCATNDVPDQYITSSPSTGDNSWRRQDQGASASWQYLPSGIVTPAEGTGAADFHSYGANGTQGSFNIYVDLSAASGPTQVRFKYINATGSDVLSVLESNDGGVTFSAPVAGNTLGTQSSWTVKTFPINSTSAITVVRFIATGDFGDDDIGIDDLHIELVPACPIPTTAGASAITATTATLNWNETPVGLGYQVRYKKVSDPATVSTWTTPINIAGINGTNFTNATGLTGGTQYEYQVQLSCTGPSVSGWSSSEFFYTSPANDNCSGAITITVGNCGTPLAGSIANASQSLAAISCGGFTGTASHDVWFKFVASASTMAVVAIPTNSSGDLDLVLDVRSGACNGVNIACADGSLAGEEEDATVTGLSIGATYFVRVYNYDGTIAADPDFTICVSVPTPPANDNCAGAITLVQSGTATCGGATTGNSNFATQSLPSCAAGADADDDVWYKFVADPSGRATVTVTGGFTYDPVFEVFSGSCGTLTSLVCQNADPYLGGTESNSLSGLSGGATYYVRVYNAGNGAGNSFSICITTPPANAQDDCSGAVSLSVGAFCSATSFNTVGATESQVAALCSGNTGNADDDVWFSFTAASSGNYNIKVTSASTFDAVVEVFSGTCSGLTSVNCADASIIGGVENLQLGLAAGTYYVRVYHYGAGSGTSANSSICVTSVVPPNGPANDEVSQAVSLSINNSCVQTGGTSVNATRSTTTVVDAGSASDVWYRFVAPTSGTIHFTISGNGGMDPVFQTIQVDAPKKNITALSNIINQSGVDQAEDITIFGFSAGQTYYLRIWDFGASATGSFTVCLFNTPPPSNDNCGGAISLTQVLSNSCTPTAGNTIAATQTLAGVCAGNADDDVWYSFQALTTNPTIQVVGTNSFNPVIDFRSGACNGVTQGCVNNTGSGGTEVYNPTGLTVGQTYYIRVYSFGGLSTDQGLFNICVFGPPPPPANDLICNPTTLPVGSTVSSLLATTNVGATDGTEAGPSCIFSWNSDVWYRSVVPASGQISIRTTAGTLTDAGMQVFTSSNQLCNGVLTAVGCDDDGSNEAGSGSMPYLHLTGLTPGNNLYIRVFSYGTNSTGTFSIAASEGDIWTGSSSSSFSSAANWYTGNAPTAGQNIVIGQSANTPVLSGAFSVKKLWFVNNMGMDLGANNLTVTGDIAGAAGNVITGSTGKVVFGGTVAQNVTGKVTVPAINITNTNAGGVNVAAGAVLKVAPTAAGATGLVTLAANAILNVSGSGDFILGSNANGTAALGALPAGAQFNGKLTMQRYVSGAPRWLFLGAPSSDALVADWEELQPSITPINNATIFWYRETDSTRTTSNGTVAEQYGWKAPTVLSGFVNFDKIRGYRIYARSNFFSGSAAATVSSKGTPYKRATSIPLTKTTNQYYDGGWNLVANPYPSQIDWNSASITKPAGLNNAVFVWNGAANNYQTYVGSGGSSLGVGVNNGVQYIPSSQAFFVRTSAAGSLAFDEGAKTTTAASFLRSAEDNVFRMTFHTGTTFSDEIGVRFGNFGREVFQGDVDADKFWSSAGLAAITSDNKQVAINSLPELTSVRVVPLEILASVGDHTFSFAGLGNFPAGTRVYLEDLLLGHQHEVATGGDYTFSVTASPASTGAGRFRLIFAPAGATEVATKVAALPRLSVWPSPSDGSQAVNVEGVNMGEGNVAITVLDLLGRPVYERTVATDNGVAHLNLPAGKLAAGRYTVRMASTKATLVQPLVAR